MPLGPRTSFALHRFTLEEGLPTNISAAHLAMSAFGQKVSKLWENTDSQEAVVTEKAEGRGAQALPDTLTSSASPKKAYPCHYMGGIRESKRHRFTREERLQTNISAAHLAIWVFG